MFAAFHKRMTDFYEFDFITECLSGGHETFLRYSSVNIVDWIIILQNATVIEILIWRMNDKEHFSYK